MWKEAVSGEIWTLENYFSESDFELISELFSSIQPTNLAPGPSIRESFRKSSVNPTLYCYNVHPTSLSSDDQLMNAIYNPLRSFFGKEFFNQKYLNSLNPLQLFFKSFSDQSFYDVHTEPVDRYGEYAFIVFMDSCDGGELIFPNQLELDSYLEKNEDQRGPLEETIQMLRARGENPRLIGSYEVKPKANFAILFKVGSIHWVNPSESQSQVHRRCVTGWPFATETLIKDLNDHCKIKSHFVPEETSR